MENTIYIALSRETAVKREMSVIANNLANMNTTGFKAERMMFVEHLVKSRGGDKIAPTKLAYSRDVAQFTDLREGPIKSTGNPLDVAIKNDGFLIVDTPNGQRYTRNGHLELSNTGQLVNQQGFAVLSDAGVPITFAPEDTDINISRDGSVSTNNGELGKIRLVQFEKTQNMEKSGAGLLKTDEPPADVESPQIIQGALETSNVQPIFELTKMIETQRAFDGVRSFIEKEDKRQRKMIEQLAPRRI